MRALKRDHPQRRVTCAECKQRYPAWRTFQDDGQILCFPSCTSNELYFSKTMPRESEPKHPGILPPDVDNPSFSG